MAKNCRGFATYAHRVEHNVRTENSDKGKTLLLSCRHCIKTVLVDTDTTGTFYSLSALYKSQQEDKDLETLANVRSFSLTLALDVSRFCIRRKNASSLKRISDKSTRRSSPHSDILQIHR